MKDILIDLFCRFGNRQTVAQERRNGAEDYNLGMVKIGCTGLTLREGRELATYLEANNAVSEVHLDLDLAGMQTRSAQMSIPKFHLLVHIAEGGGGGSATAGVAGDFGKEIYRAVKGWMGRFTDSSFVPVEVKLYGADGRLIDKVAKTR